MTAKGKSLKVANEAIWEDAVKAVQIGDNDTSEDVTAKAKKEYERLCRGLLLQGSLSNFKSCGYIGAIVPSEGFEELGVFLPISLVRLCSLRRESNGFLIRGA